MACGTTNERIFRVLVYLALCYPLAGCPEGNGGQDLAGYAAFTDRLSAGATCEELFQIRNSVDPGSPDIDRMNADLRSIGCFSSSSTRTK